MQEKCPGLGERGTADLCSCVHCPLEGLAVCCTTVPVPDSDTAGQHTLNGSPVESGEDGGGKLALLAGGESLGTVAPSWRVMMANLMMWLELNLAV